MKLHFLGTGSSFPTLKRGVSSLALQHDDGSVWLFDCGEGTQIQLQKTSVSAHRITDIFITHLHGDHLFGLPGLLCTRSSQTDAARNTPVVNIYGPKGLSGFITMALTLSHSPLEFKFKIHELEPIPEQYPEDFVDMNVEYSSMPLHPSQLPGCCITCSKNTNGDICWMLRDDERWHVAAGWIHHRVPTYGFVITEKDRPGTLNREKLIALGVPPGPLYGKLKAKQAVTTEAGVTVQPEQVLGPDIPGRTVAILGDTKDASPLAHLINGCDVLVHEATYDDILKNKAEEYGHSTASQAVNFAESVGAKALLLNHFSQRYLPAEDVLKEDTVDTLRQQAMRSVSGSLHIECADDLFVYDIPQRHRDAAPS